MKGARKLNTRLCEKNACILNFLCHGLVSNIFQFLSWKKYIVFMVFFLISCHSFFNTLLNSPKYLQDSRQIQYIFNVSLSRKN